MFSIAHSYAVRRTGMDTLQVNLSLFFILVMCKSHATNYISNQEHVIQPKLKENEMNIDMSIKARHTHGNVVTDACMATILCCSEPTRPIFILNIRSHMTLCAHLHVLLNVFNEMRI